MKASIIKIVSELYWPKDVPVSRPKIFHPQKKVTWLQAITMLEKEVIKSKLTDVRIMSNITIDNLDVKHKPGQRGTTVFFRSRKNKMMFCCDRYYDEAHNLRAIAKTIEYYRLIRESQIKIVQL